MSEEEYKISIPAATHDLLERRSRELGVPVEKMVDEYVLGWMRGEIRANAKLRAGLKRAAMKDPSLRDLMRVILAE
jgi:hypothetical protein